MLILVFDTPGPKCCLDADSLSENNGEEAGIPLSECDGGFEV